MKLKLPYSSQNWVSLIGATIALITLFMIIFLFVITAFSAQGRSYLGLVTYIILPVFLIIGLLLIPIGMYLKIRRDKKKNIIPSKGWPQINLNDIRHRNAFFIFTIGTTIFLFLSAVGSYEAFNFTESVTFCGTICHTVMKPEYIAYQNSPHARVACVECHVGSGASWYVRSKLSGLYQVYAVTLGEYPKPIPTPITNLRPARETCEECHWPQKFYSRSLRTEKHYLADETNSEWDIILTMKIGSSLSALGLQEGIHWHINPDVKIEYKASDERRQVIPWVRYTNLKTGEVTIFEDEDNKLEKSKLDSLQTRVMDCMDCHNRPSHDYKPPAFFINNAITAGNVPKELPQIKAQAMEILGKQFTTTDSAMQYISNSINQFYKENYPEIYSTKKYLVDKAINGIQDEFKKNIFPEMKVKWDAYPNNIGHIEFMGCFRCHNGTHSSQNGKLISKDCRLCHDITAQGPPDKLETAPINGSLEFKHPTDIDQAWKEMACVECHTGLNP
ncbi:cytochrome c3 family protein [Melioribacteraceae bacterium 4301-Me]|uniref:cytochrome c3 family protein n=1 Tax=Pyranulibacter aquaticus TaxID=3163344 RepID=UPI003595DC55